jgi:hypothetical protein
MIEQIKYMRRVDSTENVLYRVEFIQDIKKSEGYKNFLGLKNEYQEYERLEVIGYKIAARKAMTAEDIELCAKWIEEKYIGNLDPDLFAEELRAKFYGLNWYLKQQFKSPSYQAFVDFVEIKGIDNPFKSLNLEQKDK